ncbi:uncharacterized protein LOC128678174 [Plodia interpunctella]|uniref:uncharacterized protein LOC128678174 n=1 Tax=Plodia interpunctella TaxID=58824 RepID=UPI002368CD85|nr:uncharacterized protein LOC128678174 [Plodia interpunctella]
MSKSTMKSKSMMTITGSKKSHGSKEESNWHRRSSSDKPSPIDFDKFLPWICLQFEVLVDVTVIKHALERYSSSRHKSGSFTTKIKTSSQGFVSRESGKSTKNAKNKSATSDDEFATDMEKRIQIMAYYDHSGHLAEIAIVKAPIMISGKIIKSIHICLPFQPTLTKITIRCGLNSKILHELAIMLPHSNITEICLDGCYIPEGNYFILLDYISHLKILSLKQCRINEMVCMEIAKRIDIGEAGSSLSVLDLASNQITDRGVWYIAEVLRRNRSLVYLNLSSNGITDCGLMYIMNHLKEFEMNPAEIRGRIKRRYEFIKKSGLSLKKSEDKINQGTQVHFRKHHDKPKSAKKKKHSVVDSTSVAAVVAVKETFTDVFDDANVVVRNGNLYCIGNLTLCSLNLAYNDLDYISIKRILDVLRYQKNINSLTNHTGLIRLELDGNLIPHACDEFNEIHWLLNPPISTVVPQHSLHHPTHHSARLTSRSSTVKKEIPRH